jgi:hypothetical protein
MREMAIRHLALVDLKLQLLPQVEQLQRYVL